jgi:hypothetical protein
MVAPDKKRMRVSLALLLMATVSGCSNITSWNPFAEPRQKSMPSERRAPAMNPGGNGQSYYQSQPSAPVTANNDRRPLMGNGVADAAPVVQSPAYYQPAPVMAAAPMPQVPVVAQALPPAMPQGYAQNYVAQPQIQPPQIQAPQPQMMARTQVPMPTPQELAQYAPAAGNAAPQPLAQFAPASAPMAVYPGPIGMIPQQHAQAAAPVDPSMFSRMSGYAQPDSPQNQGYPQLSETPPAPPKRQPDEYQRLLQALEYERQQNAALQQALNAQAAPLSPASIVQQPSPAMLAPHAVPQQPAVVAPFVAPQPLQPAPQPQMMPQALPQAVPQLMTQAATPAMPLPSGVYVFNPSDGKSITLTPPGGATAITVPPSRYSTRRGYGDRTL